MRHCFINTWVLYKNWRRRSQPAPCSGNGRAITGHRVSNVLKWMTHTAAPPGTRTRKWKNLRQTIWSFEVRTCSSNKMVKRGSVRNNLCKLLTLICIIPLSTTWPETSFAVHFFPDLNWTGWNIAVYDWWLGFCTLKISHFKKCIKNFCTDRKLVDVFHISTYFVDKSL